MREGAGWPLGGVGANPASWKPRRGSEPGRGPPASPARGAQSLRLREVTPDGHGLAKESGAPETGSLVNKEGFPLLFRKISLK